MKYLQPKSPLSTRFYIIDYSKLLVTDTIGTFTIEVATGTVVVSKPVNNAQQIGFFLAGGIAGETATFTITINTTGLQIFPDTATIFVVANEDNLDFTAITKGQIVQWAWQDLRLSGYTFDHTADENNAMLARLDGLMREYRLKGINTGYNQPLQIGQSVLNEIAGIEDGLGMSIATLVAAEFMDGIGKSFTPSFIRKLSKARAWIYAFCRNIPNRALPQSTPVGAGNIWDIYMPFIQGDTSDVSAGLWNGGSFISFGIWDESYWSN